MGDVVAVMIVRSVLCVCRKGIREAMNGWVGLDVKNGMRPCMGRLSFCQKLARPNSRIDLEIILSDYYFFYKGKLLGLQREGLGVEQE
jgi:hypothetical protein